MQLVRIPLIAILVLAIIAVLALVTVPAVNKPTIPVQIQKQSDLAVAETLFMLSAKPVPHQPTIIISEGGSFDPKDLCNQFNAAFKAAGISNVCTDLILYYSRPELGVVHFHNGDDLVASVDYGVDASENYGRLALPAGKRVWQTALRVYKPYTGKGIGETIVRNYELLLRASGAKSGDIQLLIASPDKKVMTTLAADKWEDFIIHLCLEWGATPINSLAPKVGCWRYLP